MSIFIIGDLPVNHQSGWSKDINATLTCSQFQTVLEQEKAHTEMHTEMFMCLRLN